MVFRNLSFSYPHTIQSVSDFAMECRDGIELKKEFLKSSSSSIATLTHSSDCTDSENVLALTPENSVWMVRAFKEHSFFLSASQRVPIHSTAFII